MWSRTARAPSRSVRRDWSTRLASICCPTSLPFPPSNGLCGFEPDPDDDFGIRLGAVAARGERGALIVSLDTLLRMSSNPFFPYLLERIEEGIGSGTPRARAAR